MLKWCTNAAGALAGIKAKKHHLVFLDFVYAIEELVGGIVCPLINSKPGDQKLKLYCSRHLLVCASMAISLARVQETDTVISATDMLCVLRQTAVSFWSYGLYFT